MADGHDADHLVFIIRHEAGYALPRSRDGTNAECNLVSERAVVRCLARLLNNGLDLIDRP